MSVCATALSAGVIALCGTVTPAAGTPPLSQSTLVITVWDSSMLVAEQLDEVVLRCGPPGGSHPHPRQACATLASVNGDFDALRPAPEGCVLIHKPVYVEVGGNWRDRVVRFQHNYSNLCLASVESAGVFTFSEQ